MHRIPSLSLATALALALVPAASAGQEVTVLRRPNIASIVRYAGDRPMIGVTLSGESERADTLGLLITDVTKDSPADKAGLKAGDRLQAANGVSLRADRADAGEEDYAGVLSRRLSREVAKVKGGASIELRVLTGTQARTVRVTPVPASELGDARLKGMELEAFKILAADRAVLGLTLSSTGSARDTIGVFVQAVTEAGPAEKAGIIEGDRIASINGVSVRVAREDAEDHAVGAARHQRLQREIRKLKAGDAAELVVVTAGRSRTVRVTAVKASDLPGHSEAFFFDGPGAFKMRVPEALLEGRIRSAVPREEMTPD